MILIIYDSVFGNTLKIANAIVDELQLNRVEAKLLHVPEVTPEDIMTADRIVFGSPTRAFRPTEPMIGLLKQIGKSMNGKKVACFDTRVEVERVKSKLLSQMIHWFGYANDYFIKKFKAFGAVMFTEPASFFVKDSAGPLVEMALSDAIGFAERLMKE